MSDDSDCEVSNVHMTRRKRLIESTSESNSTENSPIVTTSRRRRRRLIVENESDSDSGSSIEMQTRRRKVPRVASEGDTDSSESDVVKRVVKRPPRVVSDSSSGSDGSSSSQWESDDSERPETAKIQDTGMDSDCSDGQWEKCPICLISLKTQEIGTPETCEHMFCSDCIQEWSKNMNTCPVDRQEYKMIQVRRSIHGKIYKQIPIETPLPQQNDINIVEDPTFCEICHLSDREDRMLLCDGCDLGFHLECLNPPLVEVPTGAWFCPDCSPEDVIDPEIELYELQLLLAEANDVERPTHSRRNRSSSRLIPRTRQSERVRRQVVNNRNMQNHHQPSQSVTSTTSHRKQKKIKKRRSRKYTVIYKIDDESGEIVAVKQLIGKKHRKWKRRQKVVKPPKTVKGRLAQQLRICAPRQGVPQNLPDVRVHTHVTNIQEQRVQAGIPSLDLFGQREPLEYYSESDGEVQGGPGLLLARRAPSRLDAAIFRRSRTKTIHLPEVVSSSSDILSNILEAQTKFHSKNTKFALGKNGKLTMLQLDNYDKFVSKRPADNDDIPSSSGQNETLPPSNANRGDQSNAAPTSTVETTTASSSTSSSTLDSSSQDCNATQRNCDNETFSSEYKMKNKKNSEDNTPRCQTPCSGGDSEIDIYSDIETVSTSKVDDNDCKVPSPTTMQGIASDDDDNDSESGMVIDTEKVDNAKEETTVTSTVDSNTEITTPSVTSTSEIQSEAVQSSSQLFNDKKHEKYDDDDSEDGCPNFSIYSTESITMAKNTDITLQESTVSDDKKEEKKLNTNLGLYSDSEDESIVKKCGQNAFGISDIRNMTEDISEEERSYTPCLDERGPIREGIEGLETEMISDEDRNDFDESHELKTASDGDALEINAKESELDFTRPEDYEEGEIVDKLKNSNNNNNNNNNNSKSEDPKKSNSNDNSKKQAKQKDDEKIGNKENEKENSGGNNKESAFKKLSKNSKERNYRDKDRERSKSHEKNKEKKDKKKEKRKEIQRYNVRALIAEKPRRLKDKFGRDIRRSESPCSHSKTPSPPPPAPPPSSRRSVSKNRRSTSKTRRSLSKNRKSTSRERDRKKRRRSRRSLSRSKTRSRSKTKKRRRSLSRSRERRRKSRDRSKGKSKKHRSRSRHRSKSLTPPKRAKDWNRRHSKEWSPSLSRSPSPEGRHLTPSWTPPRIIDNPVKPHNLTVILTNDANKKKKDKKRKSEKKTKENDKQKKRKRSERTPPPSKEVFASGDNILVSVSFNKENETRDVSTTKRKRETTTVEESPLKKSRKEKRTKVKKRTPRDLSGIKPVAIIDLEKSPFKELTPSPKDVIVLSDSDNEETDQKGICDSSQQVVSPSYTGPKTPPEPQVKFTLTSKQTQLRAISNPLHEPDDIETEGDTQEVAENLHKGPNTPPEPPNSPPSSPDAYDPFEPTKSRSATPEATPTPQSNVPPMNLDENRETTETRSTINEIETNNLIGQSPEVTKSHTPPLADVQPADSQSSIQATPESTLSKSPDRTSNSQSVQTQTLKPVAQTIPFSSVPTSIVTSTPTSLAPTRINILNTTIITPSPQRIVLPSPVKISPTKSTPIKPMPAKNSNKPVRKSNSRSQNGSDGKVEASLSLDSPYSPGSSDYEDLFEPPVEGIVKPTPKPTQIKVKSPNKLQNTFDALFGSPFNKNNKPKPDKPKFSKKTQPISTGNTKQIGVKLDEDNLKILDELPNSAVEMQVKDKFLKKLNRQERVVEEVKLVLKPHYNKKHINKEEYKDILRRAVPKICHNKSGEINPTKIKNLIEAYVKKVRHSKKVTSSSNSVNLQKA